jgi:hypothetical protein
VKYRTTGRALVACAVVASVATGCAERRAKQKLAVVNGAVEQGLRSGEAWQWHCHGAPLQFDLRTWNLRANYIWVKGEEQSLDVLRGRAVSGSALPIHCMVVGDDIQGIRAHLGSIGVAYTQLSSPTQVNAFTRTSGNYIDSGPVRQEPTYTEYGYSTYTTGSTHRFKIGATEFLFLMQPDEPDKTRFATALREDYADWRLDCAVKARDFDAIRSRLQGALPLPAPGAAPRPVGQSHSRALWFLNSFYSGDDRKQARDAYAAVPEDIRNHLGQAAINWTNSAEKHADREQKRLAGKERPGSKWVPDRTDVCSLLYPNLWKNAPPLETKTLRVEARSRHSLLLVRQETN